MTHSVRQGLSISELNFLMIKLNIRYTINNLYQFQGIINLQFTSGIGVQVLYVEDFRTTIPVKFTCQYVSS